MRRSILLLMVLFIIPAGFAGFKPKNVRPKKPEQYQTKFSGGSVTYAADLLLDGKSQKDFFYKELAPSGVIAVRLAVFNRSTRGVVLPVDSLRLTGPDGEELAPLPPEEVAQAVLAGMVVTQDIRKKDGPVKVAPTMRTGDPRMDPSDPRYDPRLDPNDPSYDPTDPRNRPVNDPRYNDPRYNDPRYGRYPRPGVDVILNPGGGRGSGGDLSQYEKQIAEKDFSDKAHSTDPIDASMVRDRFLYFPVKELPKSGTGFELRIPKSKDIPEGVVLKF